MAGQLVSLIGTWMQSTAQLWLVYKLTNSAALLGVFGFANQIAILLLASVGGYIGDRYNRHLGVIWTQAASMILAFTLAALTFTHLLKVWHLIFIAFLVGIVNAFDVPIRQAFLVQMVGKDDLPNAIALNSSMFNSARVIGPPIAGIVIAYIHEGWCFFLNGVSFLAVIAALLAMRIPKFEPKPRSGSQARNLLQGFRYAMRDRPTRAVLLMLSVLSFFGLQYSVFLPVFARDVLHRGAVGIFTVAELRGDWRGAGRVAVCGAKEFQGIGEVDCGDGDRFVGVLDFVFVFDGVLVFVGGFVCCGICGDFDDGGDEYDGAESRAG